MTQRSIETDFPEALALRNSLTFLSAGAIDCTYTGEELIKTAGATAGQHKSQRQFESPRYTVEADATGKPRWTIPLSSMVSFLHALDYQLVAGDLLAGSSKLAEYESREVAWKVWKGLKPSQDWCTTAQCASKICDTFREQPKSVQSLKSGSSNYTVVMSFNRPDFDSRPSYRASWTFHNGADPEQSMTIAPPKDYKSDVWYLSLTTANGSAEVPGWLASDNEIRKSVYDSLGGLVPSHVAEDLVRKQIEWRNKEWTEWTAGKTSTAQEFSYVDSLGKTKTARCDISVRVIERPPQEGLYLQTPSSETGVGGMAQGAI